MENNINNIVSDVFGEKSSKKKKKPFRISASQMTLYAECSLKWFFKYILHIEPIRMGDAVLFGGCIHKCLEKYNLHMALKDEFPQKSDITDKFYSEWNTICAGDTIQFVSSKSRGVKHDKNSLTDMGIALLEKFDSYKHHSRYRPFLDNRGKPLVEYGFHLPLDIENEDNMYLYGYIDVIERDGKGNVRIVDYKTGSRVYADDKKNIDMQPMVYQYAYTHQKKHKEIPEPKGKEQVGYILLHKKKIELTPYMRSMLDVDNARILDIIKNFIKGVKNEVFIPLGYNDRTCGWCDYKESCKAWLKGEDPAQVPNMRVRKYR